MPSQTSQVLGPIARLEKKTTAEPFSGGRERLKAAGRQLEDRGGRLLGSRLMRALSCDFRARSALHEILALLADCYSPPVADLEHVGSRGHGPGAQTSWILAATL